MHVFALYSHKDNPVFVLKSSCHHLRCNMVDIQVNVDIRYALLYLNGPEISISTYNEGYCV